MSNWQTHSFYQGNQLPSRLCFSTMSSSAAAAWVRHGPLWHSFVLEGQELPLETKSSVVTGNIHNLLHHSKHWASPQSYPPGQSWGNCLAVAILHSPESWPVDVQMPFNHMKVNLLPVFTGMAHWLFCLGRSDFLEKVTDFLFGCLNKQECDFPLSLFAWAFASTWRILPQITAGDFFHPW